VAEEGAAETAGGFPALTITGNRCPRGAVYAHEEIRAPKRVVTATCVIADGADLTGRGPYAPRRVPVKTVSPCPREKIPALLADIYKTAIALPVKTGDTVIADWNGEGINVIATRTVDYSLTI
jgi:CxxC motif-containing protein